MKNEYTDFKGVSPSVHPRRGRQLYVARDSITNGFLRFFLVVIILSCLSWLRCFRLHTPSRHHRESDIHTRQTWLVPGPFLGPSRPQNRSVRRQSPRSCETNCYGRQYREAPRSAWPLLPWFALVCCAFAMPSSVKTRDCERPSERGQ